MHESPSPAPTELIAPAVELEAVHIETELGPEPKPEDIAIEPESIAVEPDAYVLVIRLTRSWVHLGIFGFAIFCIVVSAVEALFGR